MSTNSNKVSKWDAVWRGYRKRCPHCDSAPLFRIYLKPVERCPNCGENYGHICADDLPPYLTILVVGHIIVPFFMLTDRLYNLSGWLHLATVGDGAYVLFVAAPEGRGRGLDVADRPHRKRNPGGQAGE